MLGLLLKDDQEKTVLRIPRLHRAHLNRNGFLPAFNLNRVRRNADRLMLLRGPKKSRSQFDPQGGMHDLEQIRGRFARDELEITARIF